MRASPARPLAPLAGTARIVVLPARYLRAGDDLGWSRQVGDSAAYLSALDDEIAFALRERGLGAGWAWPEEVRRSARRSAGAVPDPGAFQATPLVRLEAGKPLALPDPIRSQLRALAALHEARYLLYPVELRFERAGGGGAGRAVLRVALIDARTAEVSWAGDVAGEAAATVTPALAASVASRLADLIAPAG
jgi:hypothetical protein